MPQTNKKQNAPTRPSLNALTSRIQIIETQLKTIAKEMRGFKQAQSTKQATRSDQKTADALRQQIAKQK